MPTTFPTTLDAFTNPVASDSLSSATVAHHLQHANANDAIEAMQTAMFGLRLDLAASKVVPGATSFAFRNHADSADTLKILDSGALTLTGPTVTMTGTLPSGVSAGTYMSITAPSGTSAGGNGGSGGSLSWTGGAGGSTSTGNGGPGGTYTWTAGNGGASTNTSGSVGGGASGYFRFVGGVGGSSTNGNAGASGVVVTLPLSSMIAGFSAVMGNGGSTTFATGTAGAGAGVYFLTGNAGTTPSTTYSKGGDFDVVLGSGNEPTNLPQTKPFSAGRNGLFQVFTPQLTGSTGYALSGFNTPATPSATFIVSSLGIGIGANPGLGTPLNLVWTEIDPQHTVNGLSNNYNITLTADNANALQSQATGIHLFGPGASTGGSNPDAGCTDDEIHIYSTAIDPIGAPHVGPLHAKLHGGYSKVHIENYSAATPFAPQIPTAQNLIDFPSAAIPSVADVTLAFGDCGEFVHEGSGLVTEGRGVYGSVVLQTTVNQGWRDPQATALYCFKSHSSFGATQAAPNNTVVPNCFQYYAPLGLISGTAIVQNAWGYVADAQRNTVGATTTISGMTLVGGGGKFQLSNQSVSSGTSTAVNYGVYVTGNGGTGANVTNWAIRSDSTAPSQIDGPFYTAASASGGAGFRIPHGTAPSSPVNGDIWTTSAGGLFVRINGVTKTVTLT